MSLDVQLTTREQKKFVESNSSTAVKVFPIRGSFETVSFIFQKILSTTSYDNTLVTQTSNYEDVFFYSGATLVKKIRITYIDETSYSIAEVTVSDSFLLMESGDFLLLENGDDIILEAA